MDSLSPRGERVRVWGKKMRHIARKLRKNMTDAEQLLWRHLRDRQLGGEGDMSKEMKPQFNEDTLSEQPALEQLQRLKYSYIHGGEFDPEFNDRCERLNP